MWMPESEDQLHPFDELVADGPPATPEELTEFVSGYLLSLGAIATVFAATPAVAAQHALEATTRLIAGLSPAGSAGPVHLFAPLLEVLQALQTGASLDKTALFKCTPSRGKGRPPTPPAKMLGQARAAAVVTMLMEDGLAKQDAVQRVAGRLQQAGITFDRANANPTNTVEYWRAEAMAPGLMNVAYRDALMKLRARITPENAGSRQQIVLKALDELVAQGLF